MYLYMYLSSEGDIYVSGGNSDGELGINKDIKKQFIPIKLNTLHKFTDIASHYMYYFSCALSTDGSHYIWGYTKD